MAAVESGRSEDFVRTADLKRLSIEELMEVEVTSVSKTEERLGGASAAIAVVTNEDIRRSGATSIPEALRQVPGIHVAQLNSNSWAVSARGFSNINSEKLLVLSDTRSIYTPFFAGVFWDVQNYLLEDIDRIEVIRGPGAALWGSNAVNGVINITTKSAEQTQGLYVEGGGGTEQNGFFGARYGGRTDGDIYYRVFGNYFDRDSSPSSTGRSDDWRVGRGGFRTDWQVDSRDSFTVQGSAYQGNVGQLAPSISAGTRVGPTGDLEASVKGGNVLGRWKRQFDESSDIALRAYYDRTHRDDQSFRDDLHTVDVDFQHRLAPTEAQEFIWGLNYRFTRNKNRGKGILALDPADSDDTVLSGFLQDQIGIGDSVRITLGTKLEHNDFSGFEIQPSISGAWDVSNRQTLWAAVSRAVRVPTRLERDIAVDATDPAGDPVVRLLGSDEFDSEKMLAYELGYRWQALDSLFIDWALFHNRYEDLASLEFGAPFADETGRTVVPIFSRNLTKGTAQGAELLATLAPVTYWRLSASYSYTNLDIEAPGQDLNRGRFVEGATPKHQLGLRSFLDLPGGWQLDLQFRHLSDIESLPSIPDGTGINGYTELDARLAWLRKRVEVSLIGQNLLHDQHAEFGVLSTRGAVERSVYLKVAWTL